MLRSLVGSEMCIRDRYPLFGPDHPAVPEHHHQEPENGEAAPVHKWRQTLPARREHDGEDRAGNGVADTAGQCGWNGFEGDPDTEIGGTPDHADGNPREIREATGLDLGRHD